MGIQDEFFLFDPSDYVNFPIGDYDGLGVVW